MEMKWIEFLKPSKIYFHQFCKYFSFQISKLICFIKLLKNIFRCQEYEFCGRLGQTRGKAPRPSDGFIKSVETWSETYKFWLLWPAKKVNYFWNYLIILLFPSSYSVCILGFSILQFWATAHPTSICSDFSGNRLTTTTSVAQSR